MKILFITNSSVGDAVISTGLLSCLAETHPSATFTIACGPAAAPLFEMFPKAKRVIAMRRQSWHRHWIDLWSEVRGERWDLVVDLRGSMLSYLLRTGRRKVFHSAERSKSKVDQLSTLLGLSSSPAPTLWVSNAARARADALLPNSPFIALIPKSNAPFKDWPVDRFAELASRLLEKAIFSSSVVVLMGLSHQTPALAPIVSALDTHRVLDLSGRTDLQTACAILERAQLVIGNDSGALQIAGALRAPLVGLYGPTNDQMYAPRGSQVRIARVREFSMEEREILDPTLIEALTIERVERLVEDLFGIGQFGDQDS